MTLADLVSDLLSSDRTVRFRAPGNSMYPAIRTDETLLVEPVRAGEVRTGDIILYRRHDGIVAHRVRQIHRNAGPRIQPSAVPPSGESLSFILRGDASRTCDDPVEEGRILGRVISIERNGRRIDPYSRMYQLACSVRHWVACIRRVLVRFILKPTGN